MANVTVNEQDYTGVEEVLLPITDGDGEEQRFVLPPTGTKDITANGNGIDVAEYEAVNVNVPTGITPTGTRNITANGDYDVTQYASAHVSVPSDAPVIQSKTINANGTYTAPSGVDGYNPIVVNVPSDAPETQEKTATPSTSVQEITPDSGKLLSKVTVNAMPAGTAGTPAASKGQVNNHQVTVTPSVTNTTGYITGGTKTGTAVTVSASELVSGSETKTQNGTYDVTNLAQLVVNVSGGTPSLTTLTATENGSYTPTGYDGYSSVTVAIPVYSGAIS